MTPSTVTQPLSMATDTPTATRIRAQLRTINNNCSATPTLRPSSPTKTPVPSPLSPTATPISSSTTWATSAHLTTETPTTRCPTTSSAAPADVSHQSKHLQLCMARSCRKASLIFGFALLVCVGMTFHVDMAYQVGVTLEKSGLLTPVLDTTRQRAWKTFLCLASPAWH